MQKKEVEKKEMEVEVEEEEEEEAIEEVVLKEAEEVVWFPALVKFLPLLPPPP